jgi:magnesium-protoporphyrin IX monomethyl ester (oxidative) cyclase
MKKYMPTSVHPSSAFITSRGCPHNCIFCYHGIHGFDFRARSLKNVMNEIDYLINEYHIRGLQICDDNFSLNKKRTEGILDLLIKRKYDLTLEFLNGLRADTLTKEILIKMYEAGTRDIAINPETGSPEIFKKINKRFNLKQIENVNEWCKEIGIKVHMTFIFNFPWDNEKTIRETINFAIETDPYTVVFWKLVPFPGTPIYEYAKRNNLMFKDLMNTPTIYKKAYLEKGWFIKSKISEKRLNQFWNMAYKKFYHRPSKIISIAKTFRFPRNIYEIKILMKKFELAIKFNSPQLF